MSRKVELRPAADHDLDRLVAFVAKLSPRAAQARSKRLREALRSLAEQPYRGRPGPSEDLRELVIRIGRARYLARYQVTPDAIVIIRIWHGLEDRPD